jgi:hypothetical protein
MDDDKLLKKDCATQIPWEWKAEVGEGDLELTLTEDAREQLRLRGGWHWLGVLSSDGEESASSVTMVTKSTIGFFESAA